MSEAGDRVSAAIQRHKRAVDAARETAEEIANERTQSVERDGSCPASPQLPFRSGTTEGDKS